MKCYNSYCADMYAHEQGGAADYDEAFEKWCESEFSDSENLADFIDSFIGSSRYDKPRQKVIDILGGEETWDAMFPEDFWDQFENPDFRLKIIDFIQSHSAMCESYEEYLAKKFDTDCEDAAGDIF